MRPEHEVLVAAQMARATQFADRGNSAQAARAFADARTMCTDLADPAALADRVRKYRAIAIGERDQYRRLVADLRTAGRPLVILTSSAGLPRPENRSGRLLGAEGTFPFLLVGLLPGHRVDSYCQRYATTDDVLELLGAETELGTDADVVTYIGLNDAFLRIFSVRDLLALDLLSVELRTSINAFAERCRDVILRELPDYQLVPPAEFRANLDAILELLAERRARVAMLTTVLPPAGSAAARPGLQRALECHRQIMKDASVRHGVRFVDLDTIAAERPGSDFLLPDGLHLTSAGHQLVADEVARLF